MNIMSDYFNQDEDAIETLGCLIRYPGSFDKYRHELKAEHFAQYGFIFNAMTKSIQDGVINERLVLREIGAEHAILYTNIRDAAISEARLDFLVDRIKKKFAQKQLLQLSEKLKSNAEVSEPTTLIKQIQTHLDTILLESVSNIGIDPSKDFDQFIDRLKQEKENPSQFAGLVTGSKDLDILTGGWGRQDLIVIGGRTSMGKSAFALNNMLMLAKNGYKCVLFSLEMSKHQVYARLASSSYKIHLSTFKAGAITEESIRKLENRDPFWANILIDDTRAVNADYISDRMLAIKQKYGLDFVIVDYLQDIKETGETNDNTGSALARICRKLRKAAQDCDVPIMAMSQIGREVEKRHSDKRPSNSDLSGSTGIETSADVIGLLYRDDYYNPDTTEPNVLELNITKHRNGALGQVKFYYDKQCQSIELLAQKGFTTTYQRPVRSSKNHE